MKIGLTRKLSIEKEWALAFESLGHQVVWVPEAAFNGRGKIPDLDVMLHCFYYPVWNRRVKEMQANGTKVIMHDSHIPRRMPLDDAANLFDLVRTSYCSDGEFYMPLATRDHSTLVGRQKSRDVICNARRGARGPTRSRHAEEIQNRIPETVWVDFLRDSQYDQRHEYNANTKVALGTWRIDDGVPLRYFETLGAKTLLITPTFPAWRQHATPGVHYLEADFEDLRDVVDWALENPEEREKIAEAGWKHVMENHTWKHRAQEILAKIERTS